MALLLFTLIVSMLALSYVYAIFPCAMWLLVRWNRNRGTCCSLAEAELPTISLIIPAYNEEAIIDQKMQNALAIDYPEPKLEIIVACDGATDRTAEIAAKYESRGVKVLDFEERRGKASVINDGVAHSSGEVLLLCDANVMFSGDAVRTLAQWLGRDDIGAVSGDVRLDSEQSSFGVAESVYYQFERTIHEGESAIASMMGVDGGMYLVRRNLFRPIPADTILDDFTISMDVIQAGGRIIYEPAAIAHENATEAAKTEYGRRVRLSSGAAQVFLRGNFPPLFKPLDFWIFVSHKLLRWISPFLILVLVISACCLALQDERFSIVLAGALAIGLVAATGALIRPLRKYRLVAIPFYFVMSQFAIAHGMLKGLKGQLDPRWDRTERRPAVSSVQESPAQESPVKEPTVNE